jgi:hypothetical protein
MVSVDRDTLGPAVIGSGSGRWSAVVNLPGWDGFFDNLVDCIRQPRRNERRDEIQIRRVK